MASSYDSNIWLELVKTLPSVVTAITAIIGVKIGAHGLKKWREETIGKRKTELAEDVLSGFYQIRDIVRAIRSPMSFSGESKDRPKEEHESEVESRLKDSYYVTIARYDEHGKAIADLMTKQYRMKAMFGAEAVEPFIQLHRILSEIIVAARMLITTDDRERSGNSPTVVDQCRKWEAVIWWGAEEKDALEKKLDSAILEMERVCRPILETQK
ncbi:MAG TPA: hypothetical protein VN887_08975 [Candidatus Angelobacter sp.]|nr:hypothetical protein [Candidatus Angelobacter sp.]